MTTCGIIWNKLNTQSIGLQHHGGSRKPKPRWHRVSEYRHALKYWMTYSVNSPLAGSHALSAKDLWPDMDLMRRLLETYSKSTHQSVPILHWSAFLQDVESGRWAHDRLFARLCYLVFAVASIKLDDVRTYWEEQSSIPGGTQPRPLRHSAGWRYFYAATRLDHRHMDASRLEDLQIHLVCRKRKKLTAPKANTPSMTAVDSLPGAERLHV